MSPDRLPHALDALPAIREAIGRRMPAFFLDFDGTLAPVAPTPAAAALPAATRELVEALAEDHLVCVLSGRGMADLQAKVGLPALYYGADHGREIAGPPGAGVTHQVGGTATRRVLRETAGRLQEELAGVDGVVIEDKPLSLSVHYRLADAVGRQSVANVVRDVVRHLPGLELSFGKCVYELRPRDGWDKGQALLWLLARLGRSLDDTCPVCMGDDLTDEDMFRAVGERGVCVAVGTAASSTLAGYSLAGPEEAARFLATFVGAPSGGEKQD